MKTIVLENQKSPTFIYREADRCLLCYDPPCTRNCPAHIDIPGFIYHIRSGNLEAAYRKIKSANPFADTCGYVCPDENLCQKECIRGLIDEPIRIRELHSYVTETLGYRDVIEPVRLKGKKVAIVGAGPAGVTAALKLIESGYEVHIFDRREVGGIPIAEIPSGRLPSEAVERDIAALKRPGIKVFEGKEIKSLTELEGYDAVLLAFGLVERDLKIPGADLPGVIGPKEFLWSAREEKTDFSGKRAVVIGGGNVALDSAYVLKEKGAHVLIAYRRELKYAPSWTKERVLTFLKGVEFLYLVSPLEILGKDRVEGVRFVRMRLGEADESGRPRPVPIEGSEFIIEADIVVPAIGETAPPYFPKVERDRKGFILVDERGRTSKEGVFAAGDLTGEGGTVVEAVAQGKRAAHAIAEYLGRSS